VKYLVENNADPTIAGEKGKPFEQPDILPKVTFSHTFTFTLVNSSLTPCLQNRYSSFGLPIKKTLKPKSKQRRQQRQQQRERVWPLRRPGNTGFQTVIVLQTQTFQYRSSIRPASTVQKKLNREEKVWANKILRRTRQTQLNETKKNVIG